MIWILFEWFCVFLHFGPYLYTYLRIGPRMEELTDISDAQKTQEDVLD